MNRNLQVTEVSAKFSKFSIALYTRDNGFKKAVDSEDTIDVSLEIVTLIN
jgi:hypothetical protein